MPPRRDPVSERFDAAAAKLLRRAYDAAPGWAGTWLQPPGRDWYTWAAGQGIDLDAVDRWGLDRWTRAFKRSIYYLHKWHYYETRGLVLGDRRSVPSRSVAIVWETGSPGLRGRAVRIRAVKGGTAAWAAVRAKPESRQYTSPDGEDFRSKQEDRDWEPAGQGG